MVRQTTINDLYLSDATDLYSTTRANENTNWETVDLMLTKSAYDQVTDPGTGDDELDGYSKGSHWFNTTDNNVWVCKTAAEGAAVWYQIYNHGIPVPLSGDWDAGNVEIRMKSIYLDLASGGAAPMTVTSTTMVENLNADMVDGTDLSGLVQTAGLAADWDAGAYHIQALHFISDCANGTAPYQCTSTDINTNLNADMLDGKHAAGYVQATDFTADNTFIVGTGNGTFETQDLATMKSTLGIAEAASAFWTAMPGSPARDTDTTFHITDTAGANNYASMFKRGTIIRWLYQGETSPTGDQFAIVVSATWDASNTVNIVIAGCALASTWVTTSMKYCMSNAMVETFIVPGTLPGNTTTVDISKTMWAPHDLYMIAAKVYYKTACTTTDGKWDLNDDGTSYFGDDDIVATAGHTSDNTIVGSAYAMAHPLVVTTADSVVTIDYVSGHATTPGADAYIMLYYMPLSWRYRA